MVSEKKKNNKKKNFKNSLHFYDLWIFFFFVFFFLDNFIAIRSENKLKNNEKIEMIISCLNSHLNKQVDSSIFFKYKQESYTVNNDGL